jgi:hypothetical protein
MESMVENGQGSEEAFLKRLVVEFVPGRLVTLLRNPSISETVQLITLIVFTASVGAGYLYGYTRY